MKMFDAIPCCSRSSTGHMNQKGSQNLKKWNWVTWSKEVIVFSNSAPQKHQWRSQNCMERCYSILMLEDLDTRALSMMIRNTFLFWWSSVKLLTPWLLHWIRCEGPCGIAPLVALGFKGKLSCQIQITLIPPRGWFLSRWLSRCSQADFRRDLRRILSPRLPCQFVKRQMPNEFAKQA